MDAGALDAQRDAQVDAGPAGVRLAAVTAAGVAGDGQHLLQGALPLQGLLLGLAPRVQAPRGRGRPPVQLLERGGTPLSVRPSRELDPCSPNVSYCIVSLSVGVCV